MFAMAHAASTMEQKLQVLRADYAEKLDERIDEISAHLTAMSQAHGDGAARMVALEQVRNATHKLAGSGATFGFPAVSNIARDMEIACRDVLHGASDYGPGFFDRLYELCGRLREAANRCVGERP